MKYKCSKCGYENEEGTRFCAKCGMPITFQKPVTNKTSSTIGSNYKSETNKISNDRQKKLEDIRKRLNSNNNVSSQKRSNTDLLSSRKTDYKESNYEEEINNSYYNSDYSSNDKIIMDENTYSNQEYKKHDGYSNKEEPSKISEKTDKSELYSKNIGVIKNHLYFQLAGWIVALITITLCYFVPIFKNGTSYQGTTYSYNFSLLEVTKDFIELIKLMKNPDYNILNTYSSYAAFSPLFAFTIYLLVLTIFSIVKLITCIRNLTNTRTYWFKLYYKVVRGRENTLKNNYIRKLIFNFVVLLALFIIMPLLSKIPGYSNLTILNGYSINFIYVALSLVVLIAIYVVDFIMFKPLKKEILDLERRNR